MCQASEAPTVAKPTYVHTSSHLLQPKLWSRRLEARMCQATQWEGPCFCPPAAICCRFKGQIWRWSCWRMSR